MRVNKTKQLPVEGVDLVLYFSPGSQVALCPFIWVLDLREFLLGVPLPLLARSVRAGV